MTKRRYLTVDEAISILPDSDEIHTTVQMGFTFVGADWSRVEVIDKIRKCEVREVTGPNARAMGHGLVLYNRNAKNQSDLLFVETDESKLNALDEPEEEENG